MPLTLFTIGYESATLDYLIAALRAAGVAVVLDIRALPLSRRAGFSKTPLRNALSLANIEYEHLRGLGTPKSGRDAAKKGDIKTLRRIYEAHLQEPQAHADLAKATALAKEKSACLLCVEREPATCHRYLVAPLIAAANGQDVVNLRVEV